jgi:hypothetical protein
MRDAPRSTKMRHHTQPGRPDNGCSIPLIVSTSHSHTWKCLWALQTTFIWTAVCEWWCCAGDDLVTGAWPGVLCEGLHSTGFPLRQVPEQGWWLRRKKCYDICTCASSFISVMINAAHNVMVTLHSEYSAYTYRVPVPMGLKQWKMCEQWMEIPVPPLLLAVICSPSAMPPSSLFYWPNLVLYTVAELKVTEWIRCKTIHREDNLATQLTLPILTHPYCRRAEKRFSMLSKRIQYSDPCSGF